MLFGMVKGLGIQLSLTKILQGNVKQLKTQRGPQTLGGGGET